MDENKSLLPSGWSFAKFGDIAKVQGGYAFKAKEFTDAGVPVIRIGDLRNGKVTITEKTTFLPIEQLENYPKVQLKKGDVLMALSGATTGKNAIFDLDTSALLNQRVGRFLPYSPENINNGFLKFLIKKISEGVYDQAWGGAQPNVSPTTIESNFVSIPPLNEQKRIADKIEALQAKSNKAKKALETAKPLLDKLRQSILAAAFRGDLTADWRKKNPDVESASILLERIRVERRKRWEETELAKMKAKGKEPKNDKWKARYKEPEPVDTTALSELPEGWCWMSFESIATISSNLVNPSKYPNSPHIAPDNIEKLSGRLLDYKTIKEDGVISSKHKFSKGQIVYSKIRPYLSKCILVNFDGLCSADMYPIDSDIDATFLLNYILSNTFLFHIEKKAGSRVVLPKANQKQLNAVPVPVPPFSEQKEIGRIITQLLKKKEQTEKLQKQITLNMSKLDQSILNKAFQGELVPQDPTDEPASVLLERIKAEREATKPKKKPTKKRKITPA